MGSLLREAATPTSGVLFTKATRLPPQVGSLRLEAATPTWSEALVRNVNVCPQLKLAGARKSLDEAAADGCACTIWINRRVGIVPDNPSRSELHKDHTSGSGSSLSVGSSPDSPVEVGTLPRDCEDHWQSSRSWCNLGPLQCRRLWGSSPSFAVRSRRLIREQHRQRWAVSAPCSRGLELGCVLTLLSSMGRCRGGDPATKLTGARFRLRLLHDEPCTSHSSVRPAAISYSCLTTRSTDPDSLSSGEGRVLGGGGTTGDDLLSPCQANIFSLTGQMRVVVSRTCGAAVLETERGGSRVTTGYSHYAHAIVFLEGRR